MPVAERSLDSLWYELWLNGFVLLPGFMESTLVAAIGEELCPVIEGEGRLLREGRSPSTRSANRLALDLRPWLPVAPALGDARFRRDARVVALVERALGPWREGSLKLECPLPGAEPMGWHPDTAPSTSIEAYRMSRITLNVALVDVGERNGPMEILPGSHRMLHDRTRPDESTPLFVYSAQLRAGDALLRDGNGLHRGTANLSDAPRPMLGLTYRPVD